MSLVVLKLKDMELALRSYVPTRTCLTDWLSTYVARRTEITMLSSVRKGFRAVTIPCGDYSVRRYK